MDIKSGSGLSFALETPPSVVAGACVVGKKESEGPLRGYFDRVYEDNGSSEKSWESAESRFLREAIELVREKAGGLAPDAVFSGDLLNQCSASTYALCGSGLPFFGLYGACSTFAEGLVLASALIGGGTLASAAVAASSHFCSAERQFRMPLEYGGQRPPTAQWTVSGAGALLLAADGAPPYITHATAGRIVDGGICDGADMGAAMAPAAAMTLAEHLRAFGRRAADYDAILTGDLGERGLSLCRELLREEGFETDERLNDCGRLIFAPERQDVHAGGSGAGCSASVTAGFVLDKLRRGEWKRVLLAGTGALISPITSMQGESIPGICHAVTLDTERGK